MLLTNRTTLTQYLIEHRRHVPHATGDFNELMLQVALACKGIARKVAQGSLRGELGREEGISPISGARSARRVTRSRHIQDGCGRLPG